MAGMNTINYRNAGGGTVEWTRDRDLPNEPGYWHCFGCRESGRGDKSEANSHARTCHARW
ncbi:hypothetical protein [Nonomuraea roseoviolacea]|uniref:UBP-type domain-containing protein n=1 Tax=Nonomuraea roseoviolacea subsp. carminata TaxID=160689 RepID=A0ABT1JYX0_9ACTN|nr:hypothetical protein [Nonomuraea roseoviolacea]MCP2346935.1 hypothetical protein [Nonomuraea roseoviolacea subsp. carminata]